MKTLSVNRRPQLRTLLRSALIFLVGLLAGGAVVSGGVLLAVGLAPPVLKVGHGLISAVPLLTVGLAYLTLQLLLRPRLIELFRPLMVAAAFILWGIDQLLPPSPLAGTLGDLVILLYVVDLALIVKEQVTRLIESPESPVVKG